MRLLVLLALPSLLHGRNLFEGDLRIGRAQLRRLWGNEGAERVIHSGVLVDDDDDDDDDDRRSLSTIQDDLLWRSSGRVDGRFRVPYAFDDFYFDRLDNINYTQKMSLVDQDRVVTWMGSLAGVDGDIKSITFVPRVGDEYYISIGHFVDNSCWSYLGMDPGSEMHANQGINLGGDGCLNKGTVHHELLHALGFAHEQSRADRDGYVQINYSNIAPEFHAQFQILHPEAGWSSRGSAYDYGSVMHYGAYAFATDRDIKTIESFGNPIGNRLAASQADLFQMRMMYNCETSARTLDTYCSADCPCAAGEQAPCKSSDANCEGSSVCVDVCVAASAPEATGTPTSTPAIPGPRLGPIASVHVLGIREEPLYNFISLFIALGSIFVFYAFFYFDTPPVQDKAVEY